MPSTRRKNKRDSSAISGSGGSGSNASSTPKRKSKSTKSKSNSKSSSSKKKNESSSTSSSSSLLGNESCLLIHLLHQIDTLSQSKSKAVAAIQSISQATIIQTVHYNTLWKEEGQNDSSSVSAVGGGSGGSGGGIKSNDSNIGLASSLSSTSKAATETATLNKNSNIPLASFFSNSHATTESSSSASASSTKNKKDNILAFENTDSQMNANLIIITTHILNRILIQIQHLSQFKSTSSSKSTSTSTKKTSKSSSSSVPQDQEKQQHTIQAVEEEERFYAMVLSIYASKLIQILLADKSQLERAINLASSSSSTASSRGTGGGIGGGGLGGGSSGSTIGGGIGYDREEGLNARSVLSRAILTSMMAVLKSMSILSTTDLSSSTSAKSSSSSTTSSENGIYAKLMWINANSLETILALGSNYRLVKGGNTKGSKSLSSSLGASNSSSATAIANNQSTLLSSSILSASGAIGTTTTTTSTGGVSGGLGGNSGVHSSLLHDELTTVSVHNVNMDVRRANEWNEICSAMDSEHACFSIDGSDKGSIGKATKSASLMQNSELMDALKITNDNLFDSSSSSSVLNMDIGDGEAILKLISFDHNATKKSVGKKDDILSSSSSPTKPPTKKRRTESPTSTSSTATRTRSKTLSDKKKNVSNEYTILSADVSDVIFSLECNRAVFGGNRFNMKKWSSSAFAWTCNGQELALETIRNMFMANYMEDGMTNWEDMMKVVTVVSSSGTSTSRKKATRSDRKRGSTSGASSKGKDSVLHIPGNLVLITYASRIIDIVNEGGKLGVSSLQRNGGEDYAKLFEQIPTTPASRTKSTNSTNKPRRQSARKSKEIARNVAGAVDGVQADVVMSSGSKGKSSSGSNKSIQNKRSDIRNLSLMVMELLLIAHQKCMEANVADLARLGSLEESFQIMQMTPKFPLQEGEKLLQVLLNEDDDNVDGNLTSFPLESKKDLTDECRYFPMVHKTLNTLINCATTVSMSNGNIDDCARRLTGIGAALTLRYSTVLNRIPGKERKQQKKGRGQSDNINTIVIVDAKLTSWAVSHLSATLTNILATAKQTIEVHEKNEDSQESNDKVMDEFSIQEPLSLNQEKDADCRKYQYLGLFGDSTEEHATKGKQKKHNIGSQTLALFMRATNDTAVTSDESAVYNLIHSLLIIVRCCYSMNPRSNIDYYSKRNTNTRFTLAADCLDALRKCFNSNTLISSPVESKQKNSLHKLLRAFSFISPDIVCSIVELGQLFEQNVIQYRVKLFGDAGETESQEGKSTTLPLNSSLRLEFEQWERRLWSSHIKLYLVISRGEISLDPSGHEEKSSLFNHGSPSNKLAIFKAVAKICNDEQNNDTNWPLYLPSIHHALITTCLISDSFPKCAKDAATEKLVCDMMLASMTDILADPSYITNVSRKNKKSNIQVSDEVVLLSLRDARLFVLCFTRLPKDDQVKILSKSLSMLSSFFGNVKQDKQSKNFFVIHKDCSSFLARVITLTSIMIDAVTIGQPIFDSLADYIGQLHYYLPSIVEVDNESDLDETDWYRSESYFMGLWEEWESSALPPVEFNMLNQPLSNDEVEKYKSILESAMDLGFDTATEDRCHLLFAAWNASGKLCGFDSNFWDGPSSAQYLMKASVPLHLFTIRDDLCNLVKGLDSSKKSIPNSLLSKQLKVKETSNINQDGLSLGTKSILQLKDALVSNNDILSHLVTSSLCETDVSPTPSTFALLETTVAYTSFLMAMFTTSGTDFLSAIIPREKKINRQRKGSSVSGDSYEEDASEDSGESDGGFNDLDEEEARTEGISRFHEICEELGAAPIHPDWLDVSCRLRSGISRSNAVASAKTTLSILTEFGTKVYERVLITTNKILSFECQSKNETPLDIIIGMIHDRKSCGWAKSLSDLFNSDAGMIGAFENGLPCKNINGVKEAWTPNSAHRVKGKLQNTMSINGWALSGPELRAGAEWEILLSDSLLGACSDIDHNCCNVELRNLFQELLRWVRVLHGTVGAIVTTTALLQFSLNNCKGQSRHNLIDQQSSQMCKERWFQNSPVLRFPSQTDLSSMNISYTELEFDLNKLLSFLSDIHACGALSIDSQLSAQAAIGHLVGGEADLRLITGQKQIRNLLRGLNSLSDFVRGKDDICVQSANEIVEKLFDSDRCLSGFKYFKGLLFCLGAPVQQDVVTLLKPGISLSKLFVGGHELSLCTWSWDHPKIKIFDNFVQILQGNFPIEVTGNARLKILELIKETLIVEWKNDSSDATMKKSLLNYWNKVSINEWKELILRDICLRNVDTSNGQDENIFMPLQISKHLSAIIALLAGNNENVSTSKSIFEVLLDNSRTWLFNPNLNHVLHLLCLLSICHGTVHQVGNNLLRYLEEDKRDEHRLFLLEMFYKFLCESRKTILGKKNQKSSFGDDALEFCSFEKSSFASKLDQIKQRCCTYVTTHGEYTEQHWYNCYTCGLLWDKGCCSLCAQVCHKGHDVGYSRKSSFYCDCGAGAGDNDRSNSQHPLCKCLSPVSDDIQASLENVTFGVKESNSSHHVDNRNAIVDHFWNDVTEMLTSTMQVTFQSSVDEFVRSIDSNIIEKLFHVFNENFDALKAQGIQNTQTDHDDIDMDEQNIILNRTGSEVDFRALEEVVFSPIRSYQAATISTRISNETSADRLKKSIVTKNSIERKIIVADRRGRIIMYEPSSLLFCSGISIANVRHKITSEDIHHHRSDMCVLGSSKIKCNVIGMSLNPEDDCRLAAWGVSDAFVYFTNESCNKVECVIELDVGLDIYDCETDYIVKVEWILGTSGNIVVVFCATSVKIFDLKNVTTCPNDSDFQCQASKVVSFGYEDVVLRSGTVIPVENPDSTDQVAKIALMSDTGKLHFVDLSLDRNESIHVQGNLHLLGGDGFSFPIGGIMKSNSSQKAEAEGETTKSLGEGCRLEYLHQSNLLLYKCLSSPVIAFKLDMAGEIHGSFEFLPHILNKEILGSANGHMITGPYTNWTELGTVHRDGSTYFRVTFSGRSTRIHQSKTIYMEFNDEISRVCEIKSTSNSACLALNTNCEGMAAFMTPFLTQSDDGMVTNESAFNERIMLTSIASNGAFMVYGEFPDISADGKIENCDQSQIQKRQRAFSDSVLTNKSEMIPTKSTISIKDAKTKSKLPEFPLTIFEHLLNLSEKSEIMYGGDAVKDPEVTKRRLSMNSGEFVISPNKDGCTLTVSLLDQQNPNKKDSFKLSSLEGRLTSINEKMHKKDNSVDVREIAIVAIRILLGSTTVDYLPKEVAVMGRQIKLTPRMKRWYDIPLTDEEIMLAVRSGVVTISIGSSFETTKSPPIIDSVEVYALERKKLPHLFPTHNEYEPAVDIKMGDLSFVEGSRKSLDVSILTITHLCNLLGKTVDLSSQIGPKTLRRLIQVTALDALSPGNVRNHVVDLVKSVEKDPNLMQLILDEGTLQGISQALENLLHFSKVNQTRKGQFLSKIGTCLNVALAIARDRPGNYKCCVEKLISSEEIKQSITLQAKTILDAKKMINVETSTKLIQLCVFESVATDGVADCNFAGLDLVAEMLRSQDERTVIESCSKLAETLKELQTLGKVQAYQCDGCGIFPIERARYTLEDKNIDLCEKCFERGNKFAAENSFALSIPILVNGSQLKMEDNKVMTCSQIRQMTTKPVPREQVEEAKAMAAKDPEDPEDDEEALNKAIKMSMEDTVDENIESEQHKTTSNSVHVALITKLLEDLEQTLLQENEALIYYPIPIVDLLLKLVAQSDMEDRVTLGRLICETLSSNTFALIERILRKDTTESSQNEIRYAIMIYLRAIEGLATKQKSIQLIISNSSEKQMNNQEQKREASTTIDRPSNKDKTDPRFVCETHGVPAVRRRCSHGENKDRRFYVCGMDRKNRCKYFRWADEERNLNAPLRDSTVVGSSKMKMTNNASYIMSSDESSTNVNPQLQTMIWEIFNDKKQPLHQKLCSLLQTLSKKLESQQQDISRTGENINEKLSKFRQKLRSRKTRNIDLDASYMPLAKANRFAVSQTSTQHRRINDFLHRSASEYAVVEATLDLLSKIAMNALKKTLRPQSSWESWFELLCEIISSSSSTHLRSQAKKMMKKLCGGQNSIYHQIRDQYVFGFQFMQLLHNSALPLEAALHVREKARLCGPHWRFTNLRWTTLPNGGLIGTQQLISEDNYDVITMDKLAKILDDLINTAGTRRSNWKHFCSLDRMPHKSNLHADFCERSPICLLLWMACSLPSQNQVKVFKLIEIAFGSPCIQSKDTGNLIGEDSTGIISADGGTDGDGTDIDYQIELISDKESPQKVLMKGASALSIDDLHALVISFVLNGDDGHVRSLASSFCLQMLASIPKEWIDVLIKRFLHVLISDVGYLGCKSLEFLQFFVHVVSNDDIMANVDASTAFETVTSYYTQQLKASRDMFVSSGKDATCIVVKTSDNKENNTVFDLANCVHCHSATNSRRKIPDASSTSNESNATNTTESSRSQPNQRNLNAVPSKRRLDGCTLHSVSTEFSFFSQLKFRMAITEIQLNVNDPRGRFVKAVGVYFTPRPVKNTNELKDPDYAHVWQRCGTLTLTRGGNRAVCKFSSPIVTANLKFEYEEFYEKNNGNRLSGNGGIVIHCPRCTRVVNNAHGGVCGNCGEVAFQCRKCRHINYDRLDAFLCVECGYCSSGSFSYEICAAPASKAVAITDDEGLERAVRLMWVAGNKHNECKSALLKTLQNSKTLSGHKRSRVDLATTMIKLNGPLKRALLGDLPKVNFKNQEAAGNAKKKQRTSNDNIDSTSHGDLTSGGGSSAANRARSLLNLAIQLRGESSGNEDRSSLGGVPESLSRLVANIARGRSGGNPNNHTNANDETDQRRLKAGDVSEEVSLKKLLQTCEKLYTQMRLAERENFELRNRVIAWKRLNHDALADHGRTVHSTQLRNWSSTNSHCSSCSPIILKHLLALIQVLFQKRGHTMTDFSLNEEFISTLFEENDSNDTDMNDLKRAMIIALATKSETSSEMVLKELKMRLQGTKSPNCAEILGHLLLIKDVKSPQKLVDFAMQVLE